MTRGTTRKKSVVVTRLVVELAFLLLIAINAITDQEQEIINGLRVDPNIARDSYPWMARLGSRFSIFKTMIQGELKISIFPCKSYLKYIELTNSVSQVERDLPNKFLGLFLLNSFACLTGFH